MFCSAVGSFGNRERAAALEINYCSLSCTSSRTAKMEHGPLTRVTAMEGGGEPEVEHTMAMSME